MTGSGDWALWEVAETTLQLTKGANTIRFAATTASGTANIDRIELLATSLTSTSVNSLKSAVKCYPSYVDQRFDVAVINPNSTAISIAVVNMSGKICFTKTVTGNSQTQIIPINASALSSGIYLIKIKTGTEVFTDRIIKQ